MKQWIEQLTLNEHSTEHRYMQIYRQLKELILKGSPGHNERLPAIRQLAGRLAVNVVTIVKAYDLLEQEGLIRKQTGSGTFVDYSSSSPLKSNRAEPEWDQGVEQLPHHSQQTVSITADTINFASATPSPDLFPVEDFKKALLEVLDRDQGYAFGYQDSRGYDPLRDALRQLAYSSGIVTGTENIQIISGAQQGIDLVAKGLIYPGETVLIERPSYSGAMQAFFSRSARLIDVPLEHDGIQLERLEKTIRETHPKLIYIMPNFQNPTGISYTREKKEEIISLSEKYDFMILEDDYLNELSFAEPARSIKSIDRCDRVIYIKSFSKMFMPGLRLGYLIVPESASYRIRAAKQSTDISTSGLLQRALELYLTRGAWQRNLATLTEEYRTRFNLMTARLKEYMPQDVMFRQPSGGLNFWLTLPKRVSAQSLYEEAIEQHIIFAPGSMFYLRKPEENSFRLSIAAVKPHEIELGIQILSQLIQREIRKHQPTTLTPGNYQDQIL